jgi:exosortase
MPALSPPAPLPKPSLGEVGRCFAQWVRERPLQALCMAGAAATCIYFYFYYPAYMDGLHSAFFWAWGASNAENNQEHARFILRAKKEPVGWGLAIVALGLLIYLLGARTLQPRLAVLSLPVLIYGSVLFLWGREVARVFTFPCVFLLFMIPIGGVVQGTVSLQLLVSSAVNALSGWMGMKIETSGTLIRSLDGSFDFEIAEGCSGIRSLMAMSTLAALYVHFTQRELWKKLVIFAGSIVFAVIGNIARIFTVILVAKFISPKLAGGLYHDYSGLIFFPVAVFAMVSFSSLLNRNWRHLFSPPSDPPVGSAPKEAKSSSPVSYDY